MKILLAYCGLMVRTVAELAEAEGTRIVVAGSYEEARRHMSRGVDAIITNIQMPERRRESSNPYSIHHPTVPWGVVLAANAQMKLIPTTIVVDSLNWSEKMTFVATLFRQFGVSEPEVAKLYAGGNKKRQRDVYLALRKRASAIPRIGPMVIGKVEAKSQEQ